MSGRATHTTKAAPKRVPMENEMGCARTGQTVQQQSCVDKQWKGSQLLVDWGCRAPWHQAFLSSGWGVGSCGQDD